MHVSVSKFLMYINVYQYCTLYAYVQYVHTCEILCVLTNRSLGRRRLNEDEDEIKMEVDENFGGTYIFMYNVHTYI